MNDELFQAGIKFLNERLKEHHQQTYNWMMHLFIQQSYIKDVLGVREQNHSWTPYYPENELSDSKEPELYNKFGHKMRTVFLSSRKGATSSNYIFFDRYDYGLKNHFYVEEEAFKIVGKPNRKFAMLIESRSIVPYLYEMFLKNKTYIENNFDFLFTYDAEVLNTIKNARFAPFCATIWYGKNIVWGAKSVDESENNMTGGGVSKISNIIPSDKNYQFKTKNISMVSSNKRMCELHLIRQELAQKCKKENLADTFGTFDGGKFIACEEYLKDYRYSIAFENDITPFFFTERLLNCFVAQTIPIYIGASEIHRFFDINGIIQIKLEDLNHIEDILKQCTPEEYERRLPAIINNYHRTLDIYSNNFDTLYRIYLKSLL